MSKSAQVSLQGIHAGDFVAEGQPYTDVMGIEGAIAAKITVSETTETVYLDDVGEVDVIVEKIDLEIEAANFSLEERSFLLDEALINGSIASNVNDVAGRGYKGITFKSQKRNGAWRYYSLPKVKFSLNEDEFATRTGKNEGKSAKLIGSAVALSNGVYRVIADSDATGVNQEWLDKFLETIPQTTAPTPTPAIKESKK